VVAQRDRHDEIIVRLRIVVENATLRSKHCSGCPGANRWQSACWQVPKPHYGPVGLGALVPENPMALHVVGRTADGRLWHTVRTPTGWTAFGDVLGASGLAGFAGEVTGVACARRLMIGSALEEGLYVFVGLAREPPRLLFRSADTGQWQQQTAPAFRPSSHVAVATRGSVSQGGTPTSMLHLAAVSTGGVLFAASQPYGTTSADIPTSVEWSAGERGDFRAVGLLSGIGIDSTATTLYAASADGRVYTSSGASGGWSYFEDLDRSSGPGRRPGDALDVGAAQGSNSTDYVILTGDGRTWIASQFLNGTWLPWRDLETYQATFSGSGWSGTVTLTEDVGTFSSVTVAMTSEGAHVLGTTTNGRLWHQLRSNAMPIFRDVEVVGVGQDVGRFTAVSAA
jgi:hypothetical protein